MILVTFKIIVKFFDENSLFKIGWTEMGKRGYNSLTQGRISYTSLPANQSRVLGITLLWSVYYYMHAGTTNILLGYLFFYCSISIHPSSFTFSVDHSFSTVVSHCNWILFYLSFIFFGCFKTLVVLINLH